MFVSQSPLEQLIVSVLDKIRHVLFREPSTNSTTDESIYALTVGCCDERSPVTGGVQLIMK